MCLSSFSDVYNFLLNDLNELININRNKIKTDESNIFVLYLHYTLV